LLVGVVVGLCRSVRLARVCRLTASQKCVDFAGRGRGAISDVLTNHPFVTTLKNLRGNVRGCVFTEPLWGIPFNLYAPYVSVYMLAFGLTDSQIGLITSVGLVFEVFWTVLSGAITDKLGRKRSTLIFDLISWSVPCLIWAVAQNFVYFLVAAIINSVWRVTHNSWRCLLVEDTDPRLLVDVFSWIYIAGLLVAFVSPLTGVLIDKFTLVPTIRGLYLLAFVMMTAKFIIMNSMVTETRQGLIRMKETRDQPLFAVLREYPGVLRQSSRTPITFFAVGLMLVMSISTMVRGTFWSILVTEKLLIPPQHLALYPFARSVTMLIFFFLVMPRLRNMGMGRPMILAFLGLLISQLVLISVSPQDYLLLLVSVILEACSSAAATTLLEKLIVLAVDSRERARIMAMLYVIVIVFTSPFGWIAGRMSEVNRSLPFTLTIVLFAVGGLLTVGASRLVGGGSKLGEVVD
jgi:DHA1 family tetracycline resistance protein-like MFS transporter